MRRALILCLLLAACRNETDERLKKLEKDVADMKANPAVETIAVPVPAADTASTAAPIPSELSRIDAEKLVGEHAAFVSTPTQKDFGFYCVFDRRIVLFKWDEPRNVYRQIAIMADYRHTSVAIQISDALIGEMRDFLTRPEEKP